MTNKRSLTCSFKVARRRIRQTFPHLDITSWSGLSGKRCRWPNALSLLSGKGHRNRNTGAVSPPPREPLICGRRRSWPLPGSWSVRHAQGSRPPGGTGSWPSGTGSHCQGQVRARPEPARELTSALSGRAFGPTSGLAGGRAVQVCPAMAYSIAAGCHPVSHRRTEVVRQAVRLHRLFNPMPIWTNPIFCLRL